MSASLMRSASASAAATATGRLLYHRSHTAAATAIATTRLSTIPSSLSPSSFQCVRHAHNPRTIRGVGPAPRAAGFYRQPWLRRRVAISRAKTWKLSHVTPALAAPVEQKAAPVITVESRSIETAQPSGSVSLDPSVFQVPIRRDIVWEVVRWQRAMRRQGTHKEKNRMEVFGTGKKARPQKGSGRARVGDMHAPHHAGGGVTFPRRTSDYSYNLPQHIINLGKRVALSAKLAEGNLYVVDDAVLSSADPRAFVESMTRHRWGDYLMVHLEGELDPNLIVASRKNEHYKYLSDRELNVFDVVKARRLVVTKKALEAIQWRLQKDNTQGKTLKKSMRWMVGSYGGGYTREEIDFVKPGTKVEGTVVPDVDVDGLKLVIKSGKPYTTPIHWP